MVGNSHCRSLVVLAHRPSLRGVVVSSFIAVLSFAVSPMTASILSVIATAHAVGTFEQRDGARRKEDLRIGTLN